MFWSYMCNTLQNVTHDFAFWRVLSNDLKHGIQSWHFQLGMSGVCSWCSLKTAPKEAAKYNADPYVTGMQERSVTLNNQKNVRRFPMEMAMLIVSFEQEFPHTRESYQQPSVAGCYTYCNSFRAELIQLMQRQRPCITNLFHFWI